MCNDLRTYINTHVCTASRYKQGMMDVHELEGPDRKEFQTAAEQMMDVVERGGVEMVEEEDVDELLSWTKGLNFEE